MKSKVLLTTLLALTTLEAISLQPVKAHASFYAGYSPKSLRGNYYNHKKWIPSTNPRLKGAYSAEYLLIHKRYIEGGMFQSDGYPEAIISSKVAVKAHSHYATIYRLKVHNSIGKGWNYTYVSRGYKELGVVETGHRYLKNVANPHVTIYKVGKVPGYKGFYNDHYLDNLFKKPSNKWNG